LHFYQCLHFCGWLHSYLKYFFLFHTFVFLWFFNVHWIHWCSSWSYLHTWTPNSFASMQKFNYRCFGFVYVLNYRMHKLHLFIICFAFFTF
jgi:hypothetical protein